MSEDRERGGRKGGREREREREREMGNERERKVLEAVPSTDLEGGSVEKRGCIEPAGISRVEVIFFSGNASDYVPRLP